MNKPTIFLALSFLFFYLLFLPETIFIRIVGYQPKQINPHSIFFHTIFYSNV